MTHTLTSAHRALAAAGLLLTTGLLHAAALPEALKAAASQQQTLELQATGVQIYECKAVKDAQPARFEWAFKAPEAELFDAQGRSVGKHYAGPSWEFQDGSKVVGEVRARDAGPDAKAIPWLLLSAKSNSGSGVFAKTVAIQRIDTVGGQAPTEGCGADTLGREARISYRAAYRFFETK